MAYNLQDVVEEVLPVYPVITRGASLILQDEDLEPVDLWPFFMLDVALGKSLWKYAYEYQRVKSQQIAWQAALEGFKLSELVAMVRSESARRGVMISCLPPEIESPELLAEKGLLGALWMQGWAQLLSLDLDRAYTLGLMHTLKDYFVWIFFQKNTILVRKYVQGLKQGEALPWTQEPARVAASALATCGFPEAITAPLASVAASSPPVDELQPWVFLLQALPSWVAFTANTKQRSPGVPQLAPGLGITESGFKWVYQRVQQRVQNVVALFRGYPA